MTKKENVDRNIGITFDVIKHLVDHPDIIDTLPDGAGIAFIDKDMQGWCGGLVLELNIKDKCC